MQKIMQSLSSSHHRKVLIFSFIFIALSTLLSMCMLSALEVRDTKAWLIIAALLCTPNLLMLIWLNHLRCRKIQLLILWALVLLLASGIGPIVLLNAIYLHPDPQSPIAIFLIPILQFAFVVVAAPMVWLLNNLK